MHSSAIQLIKWLQLATIAAYVAIDKGKYKTESLFRK